MPVPPPERKPRLRSGYTTGACATAASLAAAGLLLHGRAERRVGIRLPRGQAVEFVLSECKRLHRERAFASTIKDAGDDPDVTHGATVFAEVALSRLCGVRFHAAEGVGIVTRSGLTVPVGEPAINPAPRKMMEQHLTALAAECGYAGGFEVSIGVVDGKKIARKTLNSRLGIVDGLSILGTTGIVRPFSCSAFIASIHQSIEVAYANQISHIAASTGTVSEQYIQQRLELPEMALVEMGDFAGAVFKHLRKVPISRLSICGGFGKISKMAAGHTSLHSRHSSVDFDFLAALAQQLGADRATVAAVKGANTSLQALACCRQHGLPLGERISTLARATALKASGGRLAVNVYCVNRDGDCVGSAVGEAP